MEAQIDAEGKMPLELERTQALWYSTFNLEAWFKIARLAELRNSDGYLAEWDKDDEGFILIENHCPICAAAQRCADICDAEMNTFKEIFGDNVSVERIDHIIAGARRCAYKIKNILPA